MTVKIFWDPGHDGILDPGAVGNGMEEADLVLKMANYGMDYLDNNYTGFVQKICRTGQEACSLNHRTNTANNWGADAFISIHNNAFNNTADGFETYKFNGGVSAKTNEMQNNMHNEILSTMREFGDISDRKQKQANFHVLRESYASACLTENLFIDNAGDATYLKDENFLKAVGEAHARAAAKTFNLTKKENGGNDDMTNQPSKWAESTWERAVDNGYFDGTNPQGAMTREQTAAVINRVIDNIREYEINPLKERVTELEKKCK